MGPGRHPTTGMCRKWLQDDPPVGLNVLDYGARSGILAIAAPRLGAGRATVADSDPQALQSTPANAMKYNVSNPLLVTKPIPLASASFDVLLANILAGTWQGLAESFAAVIRPGRRIASSGFLDRHARAVAANYETWFDMLEPLVVKEWVLLTGQRKKSPSNVHAVS